MMNPVLRRLSLWFGCLDVFDPVMNLILRVFGFVFIWFGLRAVLRLVWDTGFDRLVGV